MPHQSTRKLVELGGKFYHYMYDFKFPLWGTGSRNLILKFSVCLPSQYLIENENIRNQSKTTLRTWGVRQVPILSISVHPRLTNPSDITHDACICDVYTDGDILHLIILPRDENFALVSLSNSRYIFDIPEH